MHTALPLLVISAIASTLFVLPTIASGATNKVAADHVNVELVSETTTAKPGERLWVGIKFSHEPHWHTYWINPGDSGLPTRLEWRLPAGFKAGEVAWPAPKRFALGDLYNFGYEKVSLLPVPIDVPMSAPLNKPVTLAVDAKWLICNDVCIPGKAALQLPVTVSNAKPLPTASEATHFAAARRAQPVRSAAQGKAVESGEQVRIELTGLPEIETANIDAFPSEPKLLNNSPFKVVRSGTTLQLVGERSDYFEKAPAALSLVITDKANAGKAYLVSLPWTVKSVPTK